jgi:lipopolysaccharide biosynthesis glycosyltransferase
MEWRIVDGHRVMWDVISDAPMSTEHANARFLVKELAGSGWALFLDGDVLVRANIGELFDGLRPEFAAYCVKHDYCGVPGWKMDNQIQTAYRRKNWSSVLVINASHEANKVLTVDLINSLPGRDLHRLCWLSDDLIGSLDPAWNFLVGHSSPDVDPKLVHFTDGVPDMPGWENQPWADEWRAERLAWAL